MARAKPHWLLWAAAMTGILAALALQVQHAEARAECLIDTADHLALCSGPLPGLLLPFTIVAGLLLALFAAWRLAPAAD